MEAQNRRGFNRIHGHVCFNLSKGSDTSRGVGHHRWGPKKGGGIWAEIFGEKFVFLSFISTQHRKFSTGRLCAQRNTCLGVQIGHSYELAPSVSLQKLPKSISTSPRIFKAIWGETGFLESSSVRFARFDTAPLLMLGRDSHRRSMYSETLEWE